MKEVKNLISEINRIHADFSDKYFDDQLDKVKLSRTIENVPEAHIYKYRLMLHESINDYLMKANIPIKYFYRVKTAESIGEKISRYKNREGGYPVNKWMNDIFGARIILSASEIEEIVSHLDDWKSEFSLMKWYKREKKGYKAIHVYFKNGSNFYFPWELQIWDSEHVEQNIASHEEFKRDHLKEFYVVSDLVNEIYQKTKDVEFNVGRIPEQFELLAKQCRDNRAISKEAVRHYIRELYFPYVIKPRVSDDEKEEMHRKQLISSLLISDRKDRYVLSIYLRMMQTKKRVSRK